MPQEPDVLLKTSFQLPKRGLIVAAILLVILAPILSALFMPADIYLNAYAQVSKKPPLIVNGKPVTFDDLKKELQSAKLDKSLNTRAEILKKALELALEKELLLQALGVETVQKALQLLGVETQQEILQAFGVTTIEELLEKLEALTQQEKYVILKKMLLEKQLADGSTPAVGGLIIDTSNLTELTDEETAEYQGWLDDQMQSADVEQNLPIPPLFDVDVTSPIKTLFPSSSTEETPSAATTTSPTPSPDETAGFAPKSTIVTIPCPSVPEFCLKAKPITKDKKYLGIGARIAAKSPVFAVFDGTAKGRTALSTKKLGREQFDVIELKGKVYTAYYLLNIEPRIGGDFNKGAEITKVDKIIKYYQNYNLIFNLLDQNYQPIPANQIIFEK